MFLSTGSLASQFLCTEKLCPKKLDWGFTQDVVRKVDTMSLQKIYCRCGFATKMICALVNGIVDHKIAIASDNGVLRVQSVLLVKTELVRGIIKNCVL
jgi:hypothetical protein